MRLNNYNMLLSNCVSAYIQLVNIHTNYMKPIDGALRQAIPMMFCSKNLVHFDTKTQRQP